MVIDSSVVINLPGDGEFRAKKRDGPEKIKPVETSGNSYEPELDINHTIKTTIERIPRVM